jgi:hypothetical protein
LHDDFAIYHEAHFDMARTQIRRQAYLATFSSNRTGFAFDGSSFDYYPKWRRNSIMKKQHFKKLKFHTIFSVILSAIFLLVLLFVHDLSFGIAAAFLCAYVIGNGIIHIKNNELNRDSVVEYVIVSVIVGIVITGFIGFL